MANIEEIKAEMRRLFIAGDKEEFLLYLEKILDKMTDVEGEELGEWFRGLTPGTVCPPLRPAPVEKTRGSRPWWTDALAPQHQRFRLW